MNKRISVLSVPIDCVTMDEAVQRILQLTEQPGLHLVATANAEMVMLANENPTLHTILNDASLVVPDGAGILWAAERQGEHVPERVTGVDVTKELFKVAATHHIPVYCLGAAPGVAQRAVDNLAAQVGELNIAGIHDGFFDSAEEPEWMQRNRLEWLYRLYLEPQRIGRMLAIPKFMWTVIRNK